MRSNTFADDLTMKVGKTREGQQEFFTRYLQKELGGEGQGRLTDTAKARLRDDVQSVFKEILDKPEARNIDLAEAATSARDMADAATTNAAKGAEKWAERIESAAGKAEPGATFSDLRSGIGKDMETAFKNGNHELGTTLAAMQESLDDAIAATLSEGEKAALARRAGGGASSRRWRAPRRHPRAATWTPRASGGPMSASRPP